MKIHHARNSFVPSIMLVDDSPDDAFFFQRALKKCRGVCTFQHVLDGAAAVHILQQGHGTDQDSACSTKLDVIFLDLKMPVMSGFEVLEWLRRRPLMQTPPVFVLSGSDQDSDRRRALELGAAGYLVKPITPERLGECLDLVLHRVPESAGSR